MGEGGQRTGNRTPLWRSGEQGAEHRCGGTENREHNTVVEEQRTGNRKQGTEHRPLWRNGEQRKVQSCGRLESGEQSTVGVEEENREQNIAVKNGEQGTDHRCEE